MMESSVDKLKLLGYEENYATRLKKPLLSRLAFALPAPNPALQLAEYLDICAWLIRSVSKTEHLALC